MGIGPHSPNGKSGNSGKSMSKLSLGRLAGAMLLIATNGLFVASAWGQIPTLPMQIVPLARESDRTFVSDLQVFLDTHGRWIVSCKFGVTGDDPTLSRRLEIDWSDGDSPLDPSRKYHGRGTLLVARSGAHQITAELRTPTSHGASDPKWLVAKIVQQTDAAADDKILAAQYLPVSAVLRH